MITKKWEEYTSKAGSFLEQVYFELKSMYEFSSNGNSSAKGQESFGKWFLVLFNNDSTNETKQQEPKSKNESYFY